MTVNENPGVPVTIEPAEIAQLVAQDYETAPPAERSRLLAYLLRPLGDLSLVAIADGIFAKIRFRGGWPDLQLRFEDAQHVRANHVIALVERVQQVSVESLDGLAQLLLVSPMMASSAAAVLLVSVLLQRARNRGAVD